MASGLSPLQPLGGAPLNATHGQTMGMSPEAYADLRRRQSLADALVNQGRNLSEPTGSMYGANTPLAASGLLPSQPIRIPADGEGFGSIFGSIGTALGFGDPVERDTPVPSSNPRAGYSTSSTPTIGADE